MSEATVNLFFDTRKVKVNGKFPVKITIYCLDDKRRYGTGYDLAPEEWGKLNSPKLKDASLKNIRLSLDVLVRKAAKVIEELDEFSFEEFETEYFESNEHLKKNSFITIFQKYIDNLIKEDRLGTAGSYKTTLNALKEIKASLKVNEMTPAFLKRFEDYHRKKGNSETTIGINLRNVRAVVNSAIEMGYIKKEKYPFTGYVIPQSRNSKKSLQWKDIQTLLKYKPALLREQKALDLWKFSYLCNGINVSDIARLQNDNISGDFLQFTRTKTKRTTKKKLPIRVALHPMAKDIIQRWNTPDNPYIFGILIPGLPAVTQRNRIKKALKKINDNLQPVFEELKIKIDSISRITTYAARHSFATTLKRKGVSTDEISEYLGHSSLSTTKAYLDSFEDELLIERSKLLVE